MWPFKWQSCWVVFSCGAVYYALQGCSSFWVCGWNPKLWPFKWKILGLSCGTVYYALQGCSRFWVCEILTCDHLNESYWAVLSCGTVYYAPQAEVVLTFECKDTKTQMLVFNKKGYWISIPFSPILYPSVSYIIPSQRGQ